MAKGKSQIMNKGIIIIMHFYILSNCRTAGTLLSMTTKYTHTVTVNPCPCKPKRQPNYVLY